MRKLDNTPGGPEMTLEAHQVRRVAVEGEVSPGTVARYLAGLPVRPLSRLRIERGLAAIGLEPRRPRRSRPKVETAAR